MSRPEEHVLAIILARLVDMLRQPTPKRDALRATLHALTRNTARRSATVRLEHDELSVEGKSIPGDLPLVPELISRLQGHSVTEIRLAHAAAPLDLIEMLRLIAADPTETSVSEQLRRRDATTVQVMESNQADVQATRKAVRVTDALDATAIRTAETAEEGPSETIPGLVSSSAGAAFKMMLELTTEPETPLATAVANIKEQTDPDRLSKGLSAVNVGISKAVRGGRVHEAVDALITVIAYEEKEKRGALHARYGVALQRVLTEEFVQTLMPFLLDDLYAKDVGTIISRAGQNGTRVLVTQLVSARTFAERRAMLAAFKHNLLGGDIVVSMLDHHEWYVVRNFADVVGELRISEGVGALGRAVAHADARVRRSAVVALAKIGTPETVRHLTKAIHDSDGTVRLEVVKHVKSRGLASFVMPLLNYAKREEDTEIRHECYRALGRLGTSEAVRALHEAAKAGGLLARQSMGVRLAAIEGLSAAGGATAQETLKLLLSDKSKIVRDAAKQGLRDMAVDPHPTGDVFVVPAVPDKAAPQRRALQTPGGALLGIERRSGRDRRSVLRRAADRRLGRNRFTDRYKGSERRVGLKPRSGLERRLFATA